MIKCEKNDVMKEALKEYKKCNNYNVNKERLKLRKTKIRNHNELWYTDQFCLKYSRFWKYQIPSMNYKQLVDYEWEGNELVFFNDDANTYQYMQKCISAAKQLIFQMQKVKKNFDIVIMVCDTEDEDGKEDKTV